MSVADIIWEYYPTSSLNQSPLTTIYIDRAYQTNPNLRFKVNNEYNTGTLVSILTITNVLYNDRDLTFKCECNKYIGCSAFGSNNPYATATIVAISIIFNYFLNLQILFSKLNYLYFLYLSYNNCNFNDDSSKKS